MLKHESTEIEVQASGSHYLFLDISLPDTTVDKANGEVFLKALTKIVASLSAAGTCKKYVNFRKQYIALNRALNRKGFIAPRFRPSLSSGGSRFKRTEVDNLISNDHQVIDLEWLFLQCGYDEDISDLVPDRWQNMFCPEMDFYSASLFAGTAGTAENKALNILDLGDSEQLQLRAIQSEEVRSWWRTKRTQQKRLPHAIKAEQSNNRFLRGKEKTWPNCLLAAECADFSGLSAEKWCRLITGSTKSASTISTVKKRATALLKAPRPRKHPSK